MNSIFNLINPNDNDKFTDFNKNDLQELINRLDSYYLTLRDNLKLDYNTTFGFEIEFESAMKERILKQIENYFKQFHEHPWPLVKDLTCGYEVKTDILIDSKRNWNDIKEICKIIKTNGFISTKCGGHIHLGAQIIGNDKNTWLNFLKIWSTYENIIFRFTNGEFLTTRPNACIYAKPLSNTFYEIYKTNNWQISDILKQKGAINFLNITDLTNFNYYNTIEFRCPNATLNPIIWQNNLNLFAKLLMCCKKDIDSKLIEERHNLITKNNIPDSLLAYNKTIYLDQAIEFCDLIFTNNLDKVYFLKQYLKSFQISIEPYNKAKEFTKVIL